MVRFSFKANLGFIEGQIRWQLKRRLPIGKFQLENESGEILNLSDAELRHKWVSGDWHIDEQSLGQIANATFLTIPRDLSTYPEEKQEIALRRMKYIQAVDPEANSYDPVAWRKTIQETASEINDLDPPAPSTLQKWWKKYQPTKSIITLVPHRQEKRRTEKSVPRELFEEAIQRIYLTSQKLPKIAVFEETCRLASAWNANQAEGEQIKPTPRSTVYRWLNELQQDLVDISRLGAEAARIKYRASLSSIKVTAVLERVEIDHTPIDLIVIDDETKLQVGRPWLTLAVDVKSRMILGFYISFGSPSSHSVLMCLKMAILPKDDWLQRYPDIQQPWPAHGIPELVAVDNGADLHSDAFERTCMEMGIQILFAGAKTPQHKGVIERLFRTLNSGLIHRLPGTVFSNINERGDYAAEDEAVIDIKTLTYLVTKWIVEIYNVKPHKGIGTTPLDAWSQSVGKRIIELPVYPQQLDVITGIPATRTLFHYGIELEGLHYNIEQLQTIRRRVGANKPLQLKFHMGDVGYIHVLDPFENEYLQVPACAAEYAEGLSRDVHRLIRQKTRERFGDHFPSERLLQVRAEMEAEIAEKRRQKKMATRKKASKHSGSDSEQANQQAQKDATKGKKPKGPPSDLPSGLDDDLPDFDIEGVAP